MSNNPFFYGNPVPPELLVERELRRIRDRIVDHLVFLDKFILLIQIFLSNTIWQTLLAQ